MKGTVGFSIDKKLKEEFNKACNQRNINKSMLVQNWILDWLKQLKNEATH